MRNVLRLFPLVVLAALGSLLAVTPATAQPARFTTTFVPLSAAVPGVLYQPASPADRAHTAIIVMHPFASYLTHVACTELSSRGFVVLCANPHTVNLSHNAYTAEEEAPDVALAVKYARGLPGIQHVLLLGHSAGGPMLTFYQNVAENGPSICQGSEKLIRCPDSLAGLPPADGIILLDSHAGYGLAALTYVDPALASETDPKERNPALDMWAPANGFDPAGAHYSPDFVKQFSAAQGARSNKLIALAEDRLAKIDAQQGAFTDDEPFVMYGANSRIWQPDLRLQSRTHDPHPILHADGSITTDIVHSVRVPSGSASAAKTYDSMQIGISVRQFLASSALRTTADYEIGEDSLNGIDWASSSNSTPWNVEHISVPLLIMPMTGHYFMVSDEIIYNHAASADKQMAFVEGAVHGLTTCKPCEKTPGEFGDTVQTLFNFADHWLADRFLN
jgi:hypothetical protein